MFARPSTHFFLSLISFISLIATQSFADDLFTDWTPSDLNDVTISDSNNQLFPGDTNTDQLLAFNNDPSSNMFTSDSSTSDFSTINPSTSDPLNQAATDPPLDMSNMFLESTPLDSLYTTAFDPSVSDEQALPDLPSDLFASDITSPDLLADNTSGGCSSFRPSSSSRKSRKRESTGTSCQSPDKDNSYGAREEIDSAMKGFFDKSAAEQAEAYKRIVCPSAHYGKAVTIPVCSSPDPTKTARMGLLSPVFPDSETLADSTLLLWFAASNCVGGARRPYCCQDWVPNVFMEQLLPYDERTGTGTGQNCYDMWEDPNSMSNLGVNNLGFPNLIP